MWVAAVESDFFVIRKLGAQKNFPKPVFYGVRTLYAKPFLHGELSGVLKKRINFDSLLRHPIWNICNIFWYDVNKDFISR